MGAADLPPTIAYLSRDLPLVARLDELAPVGGEARGWAQLYVHPAHGDVVDAPGIYVEVFRAPTMPTPIAQAMRNATRRATVGEGTLYLWPATWSGADARMGALITNSDSTLIVVRASDAFPETSVIEFVNGIQITWTS